MSDLGEQQRRLRNSFLDVVIRERPGVPVIMAALTEIEGVVVRAMMNHTGRDAEYVLDMLGTALRFHLRSEGIVLGKMQ